MGREIRRVPPGWEHPKALQPWGYGYKPLLSREYAEPDDEGNPPDPADLMPEWSEKETSAYQIYENVSEGTPVSPVFDDEEEMVRWIVSEWGRSETAARRFVKAGYAPSFVMTMGSEGVKMSDPDAGAWEPGFLPKD